MDSLGYIFRHCNVSCCVPSCKDMAKNNWFSNANSSPDLPIYTCVIHMKCHTGKTLQFRIKKRKKERCLIKNKTRARASYHYSFLSMSCWRKLCYFKKLWIYSNCQNPISAHVPLLHLSKSALHL